VTLTVTPTASEKIQGIMEQQGEKDSSLRIIVTGMSCSGPQYMMTLDREQQADDKVIDAGGLRILVDGDTATILEGAQIDYLEGLERSGFTITNPSFKGGGGCGGGCSCGR